MEEKEKRKKPNTKVIVDINKHGIRRETIINLDKIKKPTSKDLPDS
jgi:hypothetical protein